MASQVPSKSVRTGYTQPSPGAMAGGDAPQHKPIECPKCHGVFNTRREFVNHKCSNTRLFMLAQAKKAAKKAVLKQIRNKGNKFN
ncbi:hypothetical protein OsI_29427 [Oryza sativa Indica Group]|uniref:Uncharacterized protein n=1 Tax=Oryza sativa subsp. indica TaxID=39946 RepID=B8BB89_ORYSI|nr:hypothetical protein OsI_29427 [Oryza sativa Indica Group]